MAIIITNPAGGSTTTERCGLGNSVLQEYSGVLSGRENNVSGSNNGKYSVIPGGYKNLIAIDYSSIGGGFSNTIGGSFQETGGFSTIGGGNDNQARGLSTFIGGGCRNSVYAFGNGNSIVGGGCNLICQHIESTNYSTVSGGFRNTVIGNRNFIGSGCENRIEKSFNSSILSGTFNQVGNLILNQVGDSNTIGSGTQNTINTAFCSFIGSGVKNKIGTSSGSTAESPTL